MKKKLISLAILMLILTPFVALNAQLDDAAVGLTGSGADELVLTDADPTTTAARLINSAMLFLGIIAVVVILIAGFKWMTAAGNDEKVASAKKIMMSGVIGLIIVLAAWGIAQYIIKELITATV